MICATCGHEDAIHYTGEGDALGICAMVGCSCGGFRTQPKTAIERAAAIIEATGTELTGLSAEYARQTGDYDGAANLSTLARYLLKLYDDLPAIPHEIREAMEP